MITTTRTLKVLVYLALLLLAVSYYSFASAQESDESSVATSTSEEASAPQEKWYKSEQLSGAFEVGDFVVGPGLAEIEVAPGETVVQYMSVTNRISGSRIFRLEVEDITGSADGSRSVSLTGDKEGPYSLRDWISFPEDSFTLELGERARIPVTFTVPPDAEPGGFYGSVLISTDRTAENQEGSNVPRSPLIARIGSLFFVTVEGEAERTGQTLEINTITDSAWYEEGPVNLGVVFENTGSVHLNPYGELAVTNMFGEEVGFVELEPWFVLPKSLRVREVTWDREFLLGRYTVTAKVNRGYDDIVDEVSTTFWVLPWKIVLGTFAALFVLIFIIRTFFRTFEFKRK